MYRKKPVESASSISLIFELTEAKSCVAMLLAVHVDVECDRVRVCGVVRAFASDVDSATD